MSIYASNTAARELDSDPNVDGSDDVWPARSNTNVSGHQRALMESGNNRFEPGFVDTSQSAKSSVLGLDEHSRLSAGMKNLLETQGLHAPSPNGVADSAVESTDPVNILSDVELTHFTRVEILEALKRTDDSARFIVIAGNGLVHILLQTDGSITPDHFNASIDSEEANSKAAEARHRLHDLTARQREILRHILQGKLNKNIAADLGISQRTVESHRACIMSKTKCKSVPELVRLADRAGF